jgi:hypothetical protein
MGSTFCDSAELAARVNLVFATLQTDLGLATAFRFEFPAGDPAKLRAAKASWMRMGLAKVPKPLFDLALMRLGAEHQVGRASKSLPSYGDFLALCRPRPEAVGLPTMDAAYREAVSHAMNARHRWSHPAVKIAAIATGAHDLRTADGYRTAALRKAFEAHYEQLVLQVACGEELTPPRLALAHDGSKPAAQVHDEHAEQEVRARLEREGLAGTGQGAREQLLKRMGLNRQGANHG